MLRAEDKLFILIFDSAGTGVKVYRSACQWRSQGAEGPRPRSKFGQFILRKI